MGKKGRKPGSSSSVQNKSKKSPTTSTHENSRDDWSPSASKPEASTENKSQRIDIKPLGKLHDGFLNEQKSERTDFMPCMTFIHVLAIHAKYVSPL